MKSFYIRLYAITLISILGIIVYSNTFFSSFHYDDVFFIVNNSSIRNLHNLLNIWAFYPCRFVTFLTFALNYHFHKLDVLGYHIFNVAVHLSCAILVWWLILLTLSTPAMKENKITRHANLIALLAGLVFVSHPVQTQAVTYIWERAASMATLFYLSSLCFYVKSRQSFDTSQRIYYIGSLITAIMAMFTKEMTITLPLMILLYEFSFLKIKKNINWKYLGPFLFFLFIIPLTMMVFPESQRGVIWEFPGRSPMHYFLTQLRVKVTYIRLLFLPLNLNFDYDYPIFRSLFELPVLLSALFLTTVLYSAQRLFSKYRLVAFSIFWFFLTLLPESSVIPGEDILFEHRLYLPLAGYSIFLVSGLYYLLGKNHTKIMFIALTMIIVSHSFLTYQRNKIWKDEITFWNDAISKSPHKARPYFSLALYCSNQGHFTQAILNYNKLIEINPNEAGYYNNRGVMEDKENNFTQAVLDYNRAIEIYPNYAEAYYNRGLVYDKQNNITQAMNDFNKAIEINPRYDAAYNNRGFEFYKQRDFALALSDYNKTIEINPKSAEAYDNRSVIYGSLGDLTQAVSDSNKAIAIDPDFATAYFNRAVSLYQLKEFDKAWQDVHKARALGGRANPVFISALKAASGRDN